MNQQLIDQLIKLATIRVNNPIVNSDGKVVCDDWQEGVSMSKLIELTVRECAKVLDDKLSNPNGASMAYCDSSDLLEHFGVEE